MADISRKRFRRASFIYWMLLSYIIAALVWWFISLNNHVDTMQAFKVNQINATISKQQHPGLYQVELDKINKEHSREKTKYISEGAIFLLLILVGAAFVYRAIQRQFNLQQQQQNFMMAVTHELKTPISVTRLNLETLQKYNLDPEKQKKIIRTTLDETARLNSLTNNILISAQLEGDRYKSAKEELDLSTLFKDCIQDCKKRFPERSIIENIEEDADVQGDALLLQMLINNLLENAIKYSPKESTITVMLKKLNPGICLQVSDEGLGIEDAEKQKIFNKFYRIGNEGTRKTQGTGLGLYLCRKIAKAHNADISVTNNEPNGSNFVVVFKS
ncbi:two-component sensor histidine kinase [Chitinophagaceae bacterium IBVUCB2]|nr:two-component sensor histidine kinase [Chitinophagaceae bacterium IBVUCB2]